MKIGNRHIDHIVYTVPNLDEACRELESSLGVKPVFGGYHKSQGTKNALLNLGEQCYLEILAIDETNHAVKGQRWMGVDVIQNSRISRWAIKSDNLIADQEILQDYHPEMGTLFGGSRQTPTGDILKWEMILPLATPEIELAPFMVNWAPTSIHPTQNLSGECALVSIEFAEKSPSLAQDLFSKLSIDQDIHQSTDTQFTVQIKGKTGEIVTLV